MEEQLIKEHGVRHALPRIEKLVQLKEEKLGNAADGANPNAEQLWLEANEKEHKIIELEKKLMSIKLTYRQKSALNLLYSETSEWLTFRAAARKLRISIYSLKDRVAQIRAKFLKAFPEYASEKKKTSVSANKCKSYDSQFNGCYLKSSAKKIHSLFRIDPLTGERFEISFPKKPSSITPQEGIAAAKDWVARTTYYPTYNGTLYL